MQKLEDRFFSKVKRGSPTECWLWCASFDRDGYGKFRVGGRKGRMRKAHQVSWEIANGTPWPQGNEARHGCDNPPCVNPFHIFPGSRSDNYKDMVARGRERGIIARAKKKTHCDHGHEFNCENTLIYNGTRVCRSCARRKAKHFDFRKKYPEKGRAHRLVAQALAAGRITKLPCVMCGSSVTEAHHEDYSRPLLVMWLCRQCHATRHKSLAVRQ